MEYVLLALLLAVVVLVVLNRRHADEKVARVLEELEEATAPLDGLTEAIEALEQRVRELDHEPLRHELAKLRQAVESLAEPPPAPEPLPTDDSLSRADEVRMLVERALAARGVLEVRILAAADELAADELDLRVEGLRNGLVTKGRVQLVGSEVRAVHLDDSLRQFP